MQAVGRLEPRAVMSHACCKLHSRPVSLQLHAARTLASLCLEPLNIEGLVALSERFCYNADTTPADGAGRTLPARSPFWAPCLSCTPCTSPMRGCPACHLPSSPCIACKTCA